MFLLVATLLSGCAVYMATNQPAKRNLAVLKPGTERDLVIAELGAPVTSEKADGETKEIYTFVQGYSKLTKAGRALFHGTADLFTVGLWEAVGTPVEGAFDGKRISVRVIFDREGKVRESKTLSVEDAKGAHT
jgi:outer membrane protein assembly factor BamE (lipoprotein component of BamABCDE complex)